MRWRRRTFNPTPKKLHYTDRVMDGVPAAICKSTVDTGTRTTTDINVVNCKSCIKKMLKLGLIGEENVPSHLMPTVTVKKESEEFNTKDFKNDYLARLGLF